MNSSHVEIPPNTFLGVLEAETQKGGTNGGWGNDVLTGGAGFGSVTTHDVSGAISQEFTLGVPNFGINGTLVYENVLAPGSMTK